jgi:hypothetical protein
MLAPPPLTPLQECQLLQGEPPDFGNLDVVTADLGATRVAWGRYATFLKERDELAHKDWLSMRDQVLTWIFEDGRDGCLVYTQHMDAATWLRTTGSLPAAFWALPQVWKIEDFLCKWEKATSSQASGQREAGRQLLAALVQAALLNMLLPSCSAHDPAANRGLCAVGWRTCRHGCGGARPAGRGGHVPALPAPVEDHRARQRMGGQPLDSAVWLPGPSHNRCELQLCALSRAKEVGPCCCMPNPCMYRCRPQVLAQ